MLRVRLRDKYKLNNPTFDTGTLLVSSGKGRAFEFGFRVSGLGPGLGFGFRVYLVEKEDLALPRQTQHQLSG